MTVEMIPEEDARVMKLADAKLAAQRKKESKRQEKQEMAQDQALAAYDGVLLLSLACPLAHQRGTRVQDRSEGGNKALT